MASRRRSSVHNHVELARQVIAVAIERGLKPGDPLPEQAIAQACGVSRTPIRSAFKILEQREIVLTREEGGYSLALGGHAGLAEAQASLEDHDRGLIDRILVDRAARRIPDVQSVSALARRYSASRATVLNTLKVLSRDAIVVQLPGRAWSFQPLIDTPVAISESFSFRLALEPQAILLPGFSLDPARAGAIRRQMRGYIDLPEQRLAPAGFRRLDIEFHTLVAECASNAFVRGALVAHHRLRRLAPREAAPPPYRLRQAMEEHLDILDSLERNQFDLAADQMVLHLRRSGVRRPEAANRGIPPLVRGMPR